MKMRLATYFLAILVGCAVILASVDANPHNRWSASDPRCRGGAQYMRIGRSATTNNRHANGGSSGQRWKFNGNSGSCEMVYGNPQHDHEVFDSRSECDQACLNVYHFS